MVSVTQTENPRISVFSHTNICDDVQAYGLIFCACEQMINLDHNVNTLTLIARDLM